MAPPSAESSHTELISGPAGPDQPPGPPGSPPSPAPHANPQPSGSQPSANGQHREFQGGGSPADPLLISLAEASRQFDGTAADPERNCWMAVHQHIHGVLPSEYDIREIDEELYLAVLACRRRLDRDPG